jgi:hypothetical protein
VGDLCRQRLTINRNCKAPRTLAAYLLTDPDNEHGMSVELLRDLTEQITEDEGLEEIFKIAIDEMRAKLAVTDMTEDYMKYLSVSCQWPEIRGFC